MGRSTRIRVMAAAGVAAAFLGLGTSNAQATTFTNPAAITIPATGTGGPTGAPATPYPSTITVAGETGTTTQVTATLKTISHTFADDIDVLLVAPTGARTLLMSDAGGGAAGVSGEDLTGQTYTFSTAAASTLPDSASTPAAPNGTYKPTNYDTTTDAFPAPAPAGPHSAVTSGMFEGINPNGNWGLYVVDDLSGDIGQIAGGWSLDVTTTTSPPPPPPEPPEPPGEGSNPTAITLPGAGSGPANLYPSPITISGRPGVITSVSLTLNRVTESFPVRDATRSAGAERGRAAPPGHRQRQSRRLRHHLYVLRRGRGLYIGRWMGVGHLQADEPLRHAALPGPRARIELQRPRSGRFTGDTCEHLQRR